MKSPRARREPGRGSAVVLVILTLLVAALMATPALAGSRKVVNGTTELTVPGAQVTALTAKSVALLPITPVSFRFEWTGVVSWWYSAPMAPGGTFDVAARKGTLTHRGGLRFVNVANGKSLRLEGLRLVVGGPSSYALTAAVGDAPATRAEVMVATNSPRFTRKAKLVAIDGIQFKLTQQTVIAVQEALGVTLDATTLFADTDVELRVK